MRILLSIMILSVIASPLLASHFPAYPPENAAVLYYQVGIEMLYGGQPDESMRKMLTDYCNGNIKLDQTIIDYIEEWNNIITDTLLTATEIPTCDWGLDFSKGMSMPSPPFLQTRDMSLYVLTEAMINAEEGDFKSGFKKCLAVKRMGEHLSNGLTLSYIIGLSIDIKANNCIQQILSKMPPDIGTLNWLNEQLAQFNQSYLALEKCIDIEKIALGQEIQKERIVALLDQNLGGGLVKLKDYDFENADHAFFQQSQNYWQDTVERTKRAIKLPYNNAYDELKQLEKTPTRDAEKRHEAVLTSIFATPYSRYYSIEIMTRTHNNALAVAIDVYRIKAKTGQLPDKLTVDMPKDIFSDKDFIYEITRDGFILRCQGKDMAKNKVHEYEFKTAE